LAIAIWNERFETGIALVDAQHQALFEAVNQLAASFGAGRTADQARESLDFLAKYTIEHFQTEEHFMQEMGYPALRPHAAEHARLVNKVQLLQARMAEGKPITMDVTIFLADWLKHHIHGSDMAYVRFVKDKNRE
jgi:hemerythrin